MYDVHEVVEALSRLSYRDALAYWIEGEKKEAEFYRELARRARNLGLGEELVKTFEKLAEDSLNHAAELEAQLGETYGDVPRSDLPPLEVLPVLNEFERADQLEEVLKAAMESELIAHESYKLLAESVDDERLREFYSKLADVERGHYEMLLERYSELLTSSPP
ncbi:ferritin family protein [Thermococcus sp. 21S7]|uniref:ferritin-like domain-containing protein n=1 Tax=Thermococcus sp. 21S7 TaxID=1638221 RepID=UPI001438B497|nr:ferritin family protein [Thermococcus sp. 21S7]NJE61937.1 rubrerythrin [Thermococcus sp. 21S7]